MESDRSQVTNPMSINCYFPLTVSCQLSVVSGSTVQLSVVGCYE